jgi:hypothetical protein
MAYWAVAMAVALLGALGPYAAGWAELESSRQNQISRMPPASAVPPGTRAWWVFPPPPPVTLEYVWEYVGPAYIGWWVWGCAWPWLTFLTLMIFRISMRRAKVKAIHVRRCVLYSADALTWAGVCLLGVSGLSALAILMGMTKGFVADMAAWMLPLFSLLIVARLGIAYQYYLRFDRPWATVIASQVIVLLVLLNILAPWSMA